MGVCQGQISSDFSKCFIDESDLFLGLICAPISV